MATVSRKQSRATVAVADDARSKGRLAAEATLATDCRFVVEFSPTSVHHREEAIPPEMQPSRGHMFSVTFAAPKEENWRHPFSINTWLDDRNGKINDLLAAHLRGLAANFSQLAGALECAGPTNGETTVYVIQYFDQAGHPVPGTRFLNRSDKDDHLRRFNYHTGGVQARVVLEMDLADEIARASRGRKGGEA